MTVYGKYMDKAIPSRNTFDHLWAYFLLGLLLDACAIQRESPIPLPDQLHELSGLIYTKEGKIYVHNDGGNSSLIYSLSKEGKIADSLGDSAIINQDMEALAYDNRGFLYLGDIGNNLSKEREYFIYKCDPQTSKIQEIQFSLPQNSVREPWPNFEAMFWAKDSLWMFTKSLVDRKPFFSDIYTIPAVPGAYEAKWQARIYPKHFVITGAAIDRDLSQIALVGYRLKNFLGIPRLPAKLWLLSDKESQRFWEDEGECFKLTPWGIGKPIEAVDFIQDGIWLIGSEKSPIHKAQLQKIKLRK